MFVSFRSAYLACLVAVFVYITSSGSSCQLACHPAAGTVISSVSQTSAGRPASVPLRPSTQTVDGMLGIISSSSSHILRRHKGPRGSWLAYGAFQWVEKSRKDPRKQFIQHFHTVRYRYVNFPNITLLLVLSLGEVLQTPDTPCGGATHSQRNVTLRHRLAVVCLGCGQRLSKSVARSFCFWGYFGA